MNNLKLAAIALTGLATASAVHATPLSSTVANWHFDEESGQRAYDSSGKPKNGQLGLISAADAADPSYVLRSFDNPALHFDGDDSVQVASNKVLEPKKITVELRMRRDEPAPEDRPSYLLAKGALECAFATYALYEIGGPVQFYVSDGTTYYSSASIDQALVSDGAWHHIAASYDQQFIRIYLDGVEMLPATPATAAINYGAFADKTLYIGTADAQQNSCNPSIPNFSDSHYTGDLDEVRIWNRALSGSEILQRAQSSN